MPTRSATARRDVDAVFAAARAAAEAYRAAEAERLLLAVLDLLGEGPSPNGLTRERVLLSLANVRAERGSVAQGLAILDDLAEHAEGFMAGLVASQRGVVLMRAGRMAEALTHMDAAEPLLAPDPVELAGVLLNRGMLHLFTGNRQAARRDMRRTLAIGVAEDMPFLEVQARHNLGYLAYVAGDLPKALAGMGEVLRLGVEGAAAGVVHLDRARVLFSAGLLAEADGDLQVAVESFEGAGQPQDRAEAELIRSRIALAQGRAPAALELARAARRRFERRGSSVWALLARLEQARAALEAGRPAGPVAREARGVCAGLGDAGLTEDAQVAGLLALRADLRAGRPVPRSVAMPRRGSILTRLQARQVRSLLAARHGNRRSDLAELRQGLRELHRHQASFGSLELQAGVALHGRALAERGLRVALDDGRPAVVLEWAERCRALAARLPPVRPPHDPRAAAALEELRFVRIELRSAQLAGQDDPALRARRAELEREVQAQSWYAPGPGEAPEPVALGALRAALADRGDALVAHVVADGAVHALVLTPSAAAVRPLGPVEPVLALVRTLRADLDALALRVPPAMRAAVLRSLTRRTTALGAALWAPVEELVQDRPVVLVPSGVLGAVPWSLLPGLAGRPLTVARSASVWQRRPPVAPPDAPWRVTAASGPELERAGEEVVAVGGLWPGSSRLTGTAATGEAVLAALGGSDLVHLAAHGVHEPANPLFSAVRVADGPLFGYDLARARAMPAHVVLSACDLGLATERPGDELLGMTAALLHAGAGSVLASVAQVGDDAAAEVMPAYHRSLRAGCSPSAALAQATQGRLDAPFVVFGSGL